MNKVRRKLNIPIPVQYQPTRAQFQPPYVHRPEKPKTYHIQEWTTSDHCRCEKLEEEDL